MHFGVLDGLCMRPTVSGIEMIKTITSADNQVVRLAAKLAQRKYRDRWGLYLIEGPNLLQEALRAEVKPQIVLLREGTAAAAHIAARIASHSGRQPEAVYALPPALFDRLAQTETTQGVLAVVKKPDEAAAGDRILAEGAARNLLVLDRLQDPGNLGTIIRTADAAGCGGLIAVKGTADIFAPKVVRAAAGSLFRLPVVHAADAETAIRLVRAAGARLVVTDLRADVSYDRAGLRDRAAIVIGNEGGGVSDAFLRAADLRIRIPMEGPIDSLNAAVAAAILLYERMRGRENVQETDP